MKQQATISKKLLTAFGALLTLTAGVSTYAMFAVGSLDSKIETLTNVDLAKQRLAGNLNTGTADPLRQEREMLASGAAGDKATADQYSQQGDKTLDLLKTDAATIEGLLQAAQGRQYFAEIQKGLESAASARQQIAQLLADGKADKATELYKSTFVDAASAARASAEKLRKQQRELSHDLAVSAAASAARSYWVTSLAILLSVLMGGVIVWVVRDVNSALRQFLTNLTNSSEQVASASRQIAATSQSLSQGSSEQAASLEEISASMEEMTAMSKRNSENSGTMTGMMTETTAQVEHSNAALYEMIASMNAIKASSEKVAKIIKTIDEIAFQTNILALNAAVEAARAGEAGMGFAVVADEVRNLAQRSAIAAKDTAVLIEEAIGNSNQGAEKLDRVGVSIRAITESAGKVKHLAEEVSESSKQQTQGINQASTAVSQVSKVTQTAAASAEESAAASEELSAQAQSMRELVRVLQAMVGGAQAASPAEVPAARKTIDLSRVAPAPRSMPNPAKPSKAAASVPPHSTHPENDPFPMDTVEVGDFRSF